MLKCKLGGYALTSRSGEAQDPLQSFEKLSGLIVNIVDLANSNIIVVLPRTSPSVPVLSSSPFPNSSCSRTNPYLESHFIENGDTSNAGRSSEAILHFRFPIQSKIVVDEITEASTRPAQPSRPGLLSCQTELDSKSSHKVTLWVCRLQRRET